MLNLLMAALLGCGGATPEKTSPDAPAPAAGEVATIALPPTRYDPPIEASAVPEGAWYCDMGTVHYAAGEKGDGTCPICNMKLLQKGSSGH